MEGQREHGRAADTEEGPWGRSADTGEPSFHGRERLNAQ